MNVAAARDSANFPHSDQATQEGEEQQDQEQDPDEVLARPMGGEEGGVISPS
jgi:hypothetical protein